MESKDGIKTFDAKDREEWRTWLRKNHAKEKNVWLILYKKESNVPTVHYEEAVDEALCFGWIDSRPNKRDSQAIICCSASAIPKATGVRRIEKGQRS